MTRRSLQAANERVVAVFRQRVYLRQVLCWCPFRSGAAVWWVVSVEPGLPAVDRFDSVAHVHAWPDAPEHAAWLARAPNPTRSGRCDARC